MIRCTLGDVFWLMVILAAFVGSSRAGEKDRKLNSKPFESKEAFEHLLPPLLEAMKGATELRLYEGLPSRGPGSLLAKERMENKTIQFHGFDFYLPPQELKPDDLETLRSLWLASDSYGVFRPKFCGGFHPDWCVEWTEGKTKHRLLLCFGCYEAQLFGPKTALWADINEEAHAKYKTILNNYQKRRPKRMEE